MILPGSGLRQAKQAQVQRGATAVAGDLEHVVLIRVHRPVADPGGPVAEVAHVVEQFTGRLDHHGFWRALAVGAVPLPKTPSMLVGAVMRVRANVVRDNAHAMGNAVAW